MAAKGSASDKSTASLAPKKVNLNDPNAIKHLLDETASEVVFSRGYVENVSLSNVKMVIGVLIIGIALAAQFYPKKFPENKNFLIGCIILYVIFNGLLQFVIYTKEKNTILFTNPLPGSFSSTGLAVSSKLARFSDLYTLCISSSDPKSIAANSPVEFTKSVTKWFTKDGVLVETLFWNDVDKLIDDYGNESRKAK